MTPIKIRLGFSYKLIMNKRITRTLHESIMRKWKWMRKNEKRGKESDEETLMGMMRDKQRNEMDHTQKNE